jgi:hypothetical protein
VNDRLPSALRQITQRRVQLRRTLASVKRSAEDAILALDEGRMPFTSLIGVGPLGSQDPFQVTAEYQQLRAAIDVAAALGATDAQVQAALDGEEGI